MLLLCTEARALQGYLFKPLAMRLWGADREQSIGYDQQAPASMPNRSEWGHGERKCAFGTEEAVFEKRGNALRVAQVQAQLAPPVRAQAARLGPLRVRSTRNLQRRHPPTQKPIELSYQY